MYRLVVAVALPRESSKKGPRDTHLLKSLVLQFVTELDDLVGSVTVEPAEPGRDGLGSRTGTFK